VALGGGSPVTQKGATKQVLVEQTRGEYIKYDLGYQRPRLDADTDTGTRNPHGTKYKPEMVRFQSEGKSRTTGMDYTTTVIDAVGAKHKETTR